MVLRQAFDAGRGQPAFMGIAIPEVFEYLDCVTSGATFQAEFRQQLCDARLAVAITVIMLAFPTHFTATLLAISLQAIFGVRHSGEIRSPFLNLASRTDFYWAVPI